MKIFDEQVKRSQSNKTDNARLTAQNSANGAILGRRRKKAVLGLLDFRCIVRRIWKSWKDLFSVKIKNVHALSFHCDRLAFDSVKGDLQAVRELSCLSDRAVFVRWWLVPSPRHTIQGTQARTTRERKWGREKTFQALLICFGGHFWLSWGVLGAYQTHGPLHKESQKNFFLVPFWRGKGRLRRVRFVTAHCR